MLSTERKWRVRMEAMPRAEQALAMHAICKLEGGREGNLSDQAEASRIAHRVLREFAELDDADEVLSMEIFAV
jgi:hypothetical protein